MLLAQVGVADPAPVAGYDRDCSRGHGCVFGPAKTDRHAGPGGFNGCDQFNDLARAQMDHMVIQPGTRGCVVASGILMDRYTRERNPVRAGTSTAVSIEHVRALKSAWDAGAWAWPVQRRIDLANDQQPNLLLVSRTVNSSKGDRSPGQWLPPNRDYVARISTKAIPRGDLDFIGRQAEYDSPLTGRRRGHAQLAPRADGTASDALWLLPSALASTRLHSRLNPSVEREANLPLRRARG